MMFQQQAEHILFFIICSIWNQLQYLKMQILKIFLWKHIYEAQFRAPKKGKQFCDHCPFHDFKEVLYNISL